MISIFKTTHIFAVLCFLSCISCSKESIQLYEQAAGIYFNGSSTTYSFVENIKNIEIGCDTINIPLLITGKAVDIEREVKVKLAVEDTITANENMYEILSGSIPAGEYQGYLKIKINYTPLLDDSIYVTKFKLVETVDFPVIDLNKTTYKLYITNKLTQPANWGRLQSLFGNYSNSWYRFILETTGLSSIPYWSNKGSEDSSNPDPERWPMTYNEVKAYSLQVKEALQKYNNQHPGDPLRHEDGEYKGQVITMR